MTTARESATMSDQQHADACHASPVFFAREMLGIDPTPQQIQLLDAIADPGAKVAVRSGHGTGKSTSLAIAALWFLCTRDSAKIPCTAPTAHQLQDIIWPEIRGLHARMSPWMQEQIHITSDKITIDGSTSFIVARTSRPENPEALQGFHAPEMLFIIDEAAGIHDSIFEVARGALSTPGARVIMPGNPTKLTGYFYNAFHIARDAWTRLHFSCLDSPLVAPNYAEEIAREYGEDSDMYRVRVLGDFPKHGILSIIPADRVDAALARKIPPDAVAYAPKILGVDPAWEGSDRSVVVMRQGIWARVLLVARGLRGDELAARVINFQDTHGASCTFVDKTGVGASCCDFLRSAGRTYTGISFGDKATGDRYMNRRAEIWWAMREWFETDVALESHPDIKSDLIGPEYGIKDSGKIYLESKSDMRKRGLASPDIGDALALTFAIPVRPVRASKTIQNAYAKNFNPYALIEGRR